MERFIEYVAVGCVILFGLFVLSVDAKSEEVKELYLDLEDAGVVVIMAQPCNIKKAEEMGLGFRAIGVEGDGTTHEGCWNSPDISQAEQKPGMRAIPIVNLYFDGVVHTVPLGWFRLKSTPQNPAPGEIWI